MNNICTQFEKSQKMALFQQRIDNGEQIEASDWMPEEYKETLIRQISQHANSEYVGMLPEASWIAYAPSLERKCSLLSKVQDEAGHAQYLYGVLETLGVPRHTIFQQLLNGKMKYLNIFNYSALTWADVGAIAWLTDGAAIINQVPLTRCSYGPYARAMLQICQEESSHSRHGFDIMLVLAKGSLKQKSMAQNALNRWWRSTVMVFGPPDSESIHSKLSLQWRIKLHSNDELRQKFIDQTIPQIEYLGLTVPDTKISFNPETNQYQGWDIGWDEFKQTINGQGMCNKIRIQARVEAWNEGEWVRDAALNFVKVHGEINRDNLPNFIG